MSLPSINFLHLTASEIQPGQTFSRHKPARPPAHPDTMGENNTPTALKGCVVKSRNPESLMRHIAGVSAGRKTRKKQKLGWACFSKRYVLSFFLNECREVVAHHQTHHSKSLEHHKLRPKCLEDLNTEVAKCETSSNIQSA